MTAPASRSLSRDRKHFGVLSLVLFAAVTLLMLWLKLWVFPERYIALGYVLPLLLCLWHKDRRLLWALAGAFAVMSALKTFLDMPGRFPTERFEFMQWAMQLANILVVTVTVHKILNLTERLRTRNAELNAANEELAARGEEISRQNAELQAQAEELVQQNEELQQQGEELSRQNEELSQQADELERQTEELQHQAFNLGVMNQELNQREAMLETVLGCVAGVQDEHQMLSQVCHALLELIGPSAVSAAVLERVGEELVVRTQVGDARLSELRSPFAGSFAALVMERQHTGFIDDLAARPDLKVPQPLHNEFRSVLATPLRMRGEPMGVVKVYSSNPQQWSSQQFRIIEWVAAQCSLALGIMRLQEALGRSNNQLESQVRERTASLQEMVNELEHFSYTITHDMRAPLRAIRGFVGTLEELIEHDSNCGVQDCLERISGSAKRMDRLITDALSYSKTVRQELALVPVDAAHLVRGIIASYPHFQPPKAVILIEGGIPLLLANEAGLTQCVSNLLDNAVKFVETGTVPAVVIRAEINRGMARLWFEDNGIGIPEAFRPRLFQMFQRASKTYEGTGIGLALVRKVAERMGGRVGMECPPNGGSRFWLEFKLAAPPTAPGWDVVRTAAEKLPQPPTAPDNNLRVVIGGLYPGAATEGGI